MKILFAADGSKYTKKALAFLVTQEFAADGEIVVLNVQSPVPPRVRTLMGAEAVASYYAEESGRVLQPIGKFLDRHDLAWRAATARGTPSDEIVRVAAKEKAQMIVMGTHGHGLVGRALMGSVAQRVVTDSKVPVLLVK
jgi:nucleotide-binding universal stress UspA family protein